MASRASSSDILPSGGKSNGAAPSPPPPPLYARTDGVTATTSGVTGSGGIEQGHAQELDVATPNANYPTNPTTPNSLNTPHAPNVTRNVIAGTGTVIINEGLSGGTTNGRGCRGRKAAGV